MTPQEEFEVLLQHVTRTGGRGDWIYGYVPWRNDEKPSFSANRKTLFWKDFGTGEKGNLQSFREKLGTYRQENKVHRPSCRKAKPLGEITATYDYLDEHGHLLYQVVRFTPKDFRPRRPFGDSWIWGLGGVRRILYRLPEIAWYDTLYFVEGEKDADTLWQQDIPATCIAGGASGVLTPQLLQPLLEKTVIILPDNDEPGKNFAQRIHEKLPKSYIVELPGLQAKEDVSDWLKTHSIEELHALRSTYGISK